MINPKKMDQMTKQVLNYVPSSVFPAIIFPAVLLDNSGSFVSYNDPKIISILVAILIGYVSKNISIIVISHNERIWNYCTHLYKLQEGKLIEKKI